MLAGVTIVDPASTWIEAGVEIEPDVTIHPFTVIRGEVRDRARGVRDRPVRLLSGPGTVARRGREGRHVRRAQEGDASAPARRSRTSPTSATPRSARTRTSPPATSPRTSPTIPAGRRARRRSGATSGPASTIRSVHLSTLATTLGLRRGRSSPMMCLRDRSPGSRRARKPRKGGSTRSMESLTTLSWRCRAWRRRP